jgi:hypothetical protein
VQTMSESSSQFSEFIGIYNAESTILGELSYWIGARLGVRHCSLCDITHGLFTQRTEWKACVSTLHIPFITHHINDAPADALHVASGNFPVILGRSTNRLTVVLDDAQIQECNGSADALIAALRAL